MKEYVFSIMMFLLGIFFISFPLVSAFMLSMMAISIAVLSAVYVHNLKKAMKPEPVFIRVRSWDN